MPEPADQPVKHGRSVAARILGAIRGFIRRMSEGESNYHYELRNGQIICSTPTLCEDGQHRDVRVAIDEIAGWCVCWYARTMVIIELRDGGSVEWRDDHFELIPLLTKALPHLEKKEQY